MCSACYQKAGRRRKNPTLKPTGKRDGRSSEPEYQSWRSMLCRAKNDKRYISKGIKVCERWLGPEGYDHFLEDMGRKPSSEKATDKPNSKAKWSIDRIDNDGDYTPENCRWADRTTQSVNRSITNKIPGFCQKPNGSWDAHIQIRGVRARRQFKTFEEAKAWRDSTKEKLESLVI